MNFLKKGPELKRPELKVPDFLLDIYYDLRERHLLPLVALLIVAIVAVPFLLGGSSSDPETGESEAATPSTSAAVPTSKLVVAKSTPGLRDYRRRLDDQHAKNPFVQQYSGEEKAANEISGTEGSPSSDGSEESSVTIESSESSTETTEATQPSEKGGGEPPENGQLKYYSWAIDVRVTPVPSEKEKKPEPSVRNNLPDMTMLPSRSVPALTFIGVTKDTKRAVMLVSDKVTGLFGDGVCIVGSEACQLVALEPGLPETVVYGGDSRTYRVEVTKLSLLKTDKLNVAPLGQSKKKHDSPKGSVG